MECVKVLVAAALEDWPLPCLQPIPQQQALKIRKSHICNTMLASKQTNDALSGVI